MLNFWQLSEIYKNKRLVIVDIQPSYKSHINFNIYQFMQFASEYSSILMLFNGPDLGMEDQNAIKEWYYECGFPEENLHKIQFFEKNYGFFRDVMDQCWLRQHIVKLIQYMIKKNISDIRELSENDVKFLKIPELAFDSLENHGFYIPELQSILPKWSGSDMCGGGFYECLDEVVLLSEAMKLKFNLVKQFVYGN